MSRDQIVLSLAALLAAWAFAQRAGVETSEPGWASLRSADPPWQSVLEAAAETTRLESEAGYLNFGGRLVEAPVLTE